MSIHTAGGCQDCHREDGIDFLVSTEIWDIVLTGHKHYFCLDNKGCEDFLTVDKEYEAFPDDEVEAAGKLSIFDDTGVYYNYEQGRFRKNTEGVGGVLCLACFDSRACATQVNYRDHLVVFGRHSWMCADYEGGMPE
jgi:hypothetical protein